MKNSLFSLLFLPFVWINKNNYLTLQGENNNYMNNKEYDILEEERGMASEPPAISVMMDSRSDISQAISGDELKARLHEGLKSLFA